MKNTNIKTIFIKWNLIVFNLLIILLVSITNVTAQTCIVLDPTPSNRPHFRPRTRVFYHFDNSIVSGSQLMTQIKTAFNNWTTANQLNCSKIDFVEGTAPANYPYGNITVKKEVINSNYASEGGGSADFLQTAPGIEVTTASLSINPDLKLSPENPISLTDPTQTATYATIFTKLAMHEIGHGM